MTCVTCDLYASSYPRGSSAAQRPDLLTYMKLKVIRKILDVTTSSQNKNSKRLAAMHEEMNEARGLARAHSAVENT